MTEEHAERPLTVPAEWFWRTSVLPNQCARHGRPVAHRVTFDLQSRPRSDYRRSANLLGTAARLSDKASKTKIVKLRDWPLCATCYRKHRLLRVLAGVLFWGGLAALLIPIGLRIGTGETEPLLLIPMLAGIFAMIMSAFVFALSGLARLIGAHTSDDGTAVLITDPHPRFAAELATLLR